ncbi:MAG TPA: hypothetical protein VE753_06525 [Gaiellaceae bacterium]|nr:hypothetical protein [Gaiellaceae bacterium]
MIASSAGAALLMTLSGVRKNALEWKRRRRICPSCGRERRGGACSCC